MCSPWDVRVAAVVALLWSTGMRVGEAATLRWSDVDLESGLVRVTSSKARSFRLAALDGVAVERLWAWRLRGDVRGGCDTRVFPFIAALAAARRHETRGRATARLAPRLRRPLVAAGRLAGLAAGDLRMEDIGDGVAVHEGAGR